MNALRVGVREGWRAYRHRVQQGVGRWEAARWGIEFGWMVMRLGR